MRLVLMLVLGTVLFQSAISPVLIPEDCPVQEARHSDDDCSPLCVTCACSPIGHAFQTEIVTVAAVIITPTLTPRNPNAGTPEAPPREILHVPLAIFTL